MRGPFALRLHNLISTPPWISTVDPKEPRKAVVCPANPEAEEGVVLVRWVWGFRRCPATTPLSGGRFSLLSLGAWLLVCPLTIKQTNWKASEGRGPGKVNLDGCPVSAQLHPCLPDPLCTRLCAEGRPQKTWLLLRERAESRKSASRGKSAFPGKGAQVAQTGGGRFSRRK